MNKFLQVWISAENKEQADNIMNALLDEKLIVGGQMISAPARFWWKKEIVDMDYVSINSFTLEKNKQKIIEVVEKVSVEEVPMISFTEFTGNEKFTKWIEETLND